MASTTCTTTGLTIPECSCTGCLTDQVRRYRPQLLQGKTGDGNPSASDSRPRWN